MPRYKTPKSIAELLELQKEARQKVKREGPPKPVSYDAAYAALQRTMNVITRETISGRNKDNLKANSKRLKRGKGLKEFEDKYWNTPGFIIAAGPSLDKNVQELKRAEGRWPIFAVDAALPILEKHNVKPDYLMVIDTKDWQKEFFKNYKCGKTTLLAITCIHPSALSAWSGKVRFFNTWANPEDTEEQLKYGKDFGSLDVGGNVSSSLLSFMKCFCRCNPIVFVGHDFSYPHSRFDTEYYAAGGHQNMRPKAKSHFLSWDIYGAWVETDASLWSYKEWTERWIKSLLAVLRKGERKLKVPLTKHRFINATEGGIFGTGEKVLRNKNNIMEFTTLKETINEFEIKGA